MTSPTVISGRLMTTPDPDPRAPPRAASSPTPSPDPAPRRRRPRSAALLVVAAGLVVLATLAVLWALGSSQAPDGSATAGNPATSANPAPDRHRHRSTEFQQFLADCAHSFEGWRPGQVTYPHDVDVPLAGSRNYRARIDISPGAQDRPAPDADTAAVPLEVRCGIGARLVPVGTSVDVDDQDWVLLEFGEPGTVEWNWTITAGEPRDAQVRLELRPAVALVDGGYTVPAEDTNPGTTTTTFTTDVHVQTSLLQRAGTWVTDSWPVITSVAVALGGGILALLTWGKKVRTAARALQDPAQREPGGTSSASPVGGARRRPARQAGRRH